MSSRRLWNGWPSTGRASFLYKESRARVQWQPQRLRRIQIDFPQTARVVLGKERAPNYNFQSVAAEANGKNTNYQDD